MHRNERKESSVVKVQAASLAQTLQAAATFQQEGKLSDAARLYVAVLARDPGHLGALHALGVLRAQQGKCEEAARLLRELLARTPDSAIAHYNLGTMLQELGRYAEARTCYETAIALKSDFAEAHNNLGITLHAIGLYAAAIPHYERVIALQPDHAAAYNNLGITLQALGRQQEAKASYERALAVDPDYVNAHNNLGNALYALDLYDQAIVHYQRALALKPDYAEAYNNVGNVLYALDRYEEAVTQYEQAVALKPDYADAYGNLGTALVAIGRLAAARQAFGTAIAIAPKRAVFYRYLSQCTTFGADDPHLQAMEELERDTISLTVDDRIDLNFSLGNALAHLGQPERSFPHLRTANELKRGQIVYDETDALAMTDRICAVFTPELMRAKAGLGNPSPAPIFILGMSRSGSTLIEQILASHPDVSAAGEIDALTRAVNSLTRGDDGSARYPEMVRELDGAALRKIGAHYLDGLFARVPAALRVTDKLPSNCFMAGLIHLVLPQARIIHTCRDPVDTCLSCFTTLFRDGHAWSYDLGELGRHYRSYAAVMAHWRAVLPQGVMLDVQYEDVVGDLEGQVRRILAHCGLAWNDACLAFHRTERLVRTASAAQVRQPLYHSSVGRWRAYRPLLQPLLDALGPELVADAH
jgi:tetratricopeptide (TPR) repeat protein